jgi:hypothetical protein
LKLGVSEKLHENAPNSLRPSLQRISRKSSIWMTTHSCCGSMIAPVRRNANGYPSNAAFRVPQRTGRRNQLSGAELALSHCLHPIACRGPTLSRELGCLDCRTADGSMRRSSACRSGEIPRTKRVAASRRLKSGPRWRRAMHSAPQGSRHLGKRGVHPPRTAQNPSDVCGNQRGALTNRTYSKLTGRIPNLARIPSISSSQPLRCHLNLRTL